MKKSKKKKIALIGPPGPPGPAGPPGPCGPGNDLSDELANLDKRVRQLEAIVLSDGSEN